MEKLHAGFGRVNITPMMGIRLRGYFKERRADGVLDELELNAIALALGDEMVLLLSADLACIPRDVIQDYRTHVAEVVGVPEHAIYIHATHPHTGPMLLKETSEVLEQEYYQFLRRKLADVALLALADLKPAKMGWGVGNAPNVAFVRRYRMKDGSIRTNPGVNNPDILEPLGKVDERVSVLRFDRENADSIVLASFGNHPDTVGGCKVSADWPGFVRRTVERSLDNTKCVFFNGIQGDVNHVNVHPKDGDFNDMIMDFDDVSRGYGHARYVGRVVAAGVLQTFDKVKYIDVTSLRSMQKAIRVPSNQGTEEELKKYRHIYELHQSGRDDEIPFRGMLLTTELAKASRMIALEHGPEYFDMELSAVAIGKVILVCIPGEPFTHFGLRIKVTEDWELVIPTCLTNGAEGYFPTNEAYEEGGYEAASTRFKTGVEDLLVDEAKIMMDLLKSVEYVNYAHRGASQYFPENTLISFQKGIELGANGIELDLQKTKDNKIVIFHDDIIDNKSNGTGKISEYTYDELLKLDFGSWFDAKYKDAKLMLFEDFAKEFLNKDLTFAIELKEAGIENEVLQIIKKYQTHDKIYISSFQYKALENMRKLDEEIKLSWLIQERINQNNIDKLLKINGSQICPSADLVDAEAVDLAMRNGLEVRLWGVVNTELMRKVYHLNIAGMTVNFPDKLAELLNTK